MRPSLSSRERFFLSLLLSGAIAVVSVRLGLSAHHSWQEHASPPRVMLAHSLFYFNGSSPYNAMDGVLSTAWYENFTPVDLSPSKAPPISSPPLAGSYLQGSLALTYFPGEKPIPNPIRSLVIWTSDPATGKSPYGRPARIRLIVFGQDQVDADREYRLPGKPLFLGSTLITLPDLPGPFRIPLDFLPPMAPMDQFPHGLQELWYRIEIESIYGNGSNDNVAIYEVDFHQERSVHNEIPVPYAIEIRGAVERWNIP